MSDVLRGRGETDRVAALEGAVAERTRDLSAALEQRTALLHELDHRVKNNLQLMSSLMLLQVRREPDPAVKAALSDMQARLNAVAVVHRRLFQNEDVRTFDVAEFMRDLIAEIGASTGVAFDSQLSSVPAPVSKAAALALLVNEVVGGPARRCPGSQMVVRLAKVNQGLRIEIDDCGVGYQTDPRKAGFGPAIEQLLGRQLDAQIVRRELAEGGMRTTMTLDF